MQSQNAMFVLATMNFISNFTLLEISFCLCCENVESQRQNWLNSFPDGNVKRLSL